MPRSIFILTLITLMLLPGFLAVRAEPKTLWSIGRADRSGREFALRGNYEGFLSRFGEGVRFEAGSGGPAAWPWIHPGPDDAWAGSRTHRFTVGFDAAGPSDGTATLVVDLTGAHASLPPDLEASLNGRAQTVPVPPGPGDEVLYDESRARPSSLRLDFPASLLRAGRNEVALTLPTGSWMLYDAVRLDVNPEKVFEPVRDLRLTDSPLFIRRDGRLHQVAWADVRSFDGEAATLTSRCGEHETSEPVTLVSGQNHIPLTVPEVARPTPITVTLRVGQRALTAEGSVTPQRKWHVFIDPSVHTDIGYTDHQENVRRLHAENLDRTMRMLGDDPHFHWNLEVAWQAQSYMADRPEPVRRGFVDEMRRGRLGLHAGYLNMLTGLMSDEEMNRYAYYAAELHREHGIPLAEATLTDVPTATWSLVSALRGSGVSTFAQGINQTRAPVLTNSGLATPFYWEGPDGARILTWLSNGYAQSAWLGSRATMPIMEANLTRLAREFDRPDYPFNAIYVFGALSDNVPMDPGYGRLVPRWNATWEYPKIYLANSGDFFGHIEREDRARIPVVRGDFGAYWEDGAASTALETATNRANQRRITAAETLWSLARLAGHTATYPVERFDRAWEQIFLYDEHTWGAHQSITDPDSEQTKGQWAVKAGYTTTARRATEALQAEGLHGYLQQIPAKRGDVVVVNTLSWPRSGPVPLPKDVPAGRVLVDDRGRPVETQSLDGRTVLLARDVPPLGARVYRAVEGKPTTATAPAQPAAVLENRYYRIRLDPRRGIVGILDRSTGRELVDTRSPYRMGQLVYAAGGEGTSLINVGMPAPRFVHGPAAEGSPEPGAVHVTGARVTGVRSGANGPLYSEAIIDSTARTFPRIETRVRLYHASPRIEIMVDVDKEEVRSKEAVYVAFPFRLANPGFRLGLPNASARPDRDFVRGACHDWYAVSDWVSAWGAGGPRILWSSPDAPLITLGDINRGEWRADMRPQSGTLFSYVMNNYWFTNYKAGQGGRFTFRYVFTTDPGADPDRFGREVSQSLLAGLSPGAKAGGRILRVTGKDVVLVTVKGAQDGRGTILRLRNTGPSSTTARIALPGGWYRAERNTLVEEKEADLPVVDGETTVPMGPRRTVTVRLLPPAGP